MRETATRLHQAGRSELFKNTVEHEMVEPTVKALLNQYEQVLKENERMEAQNRDQYERGKREENERWQNYTTTLKETIQQLSSNNKRLESEREQFIATNTELQRAKDRLEKGKAEADDKHNSELERLATSYDLRLIEMDRERGAERKQHEGEVADIRRKHANDMKILRDEYDEEERSMQEEHEASMRDLVNESNEEKRRHEASMRDLVNESNEEKRRHEEEVTYLGLKHDSQIKQMQQEQKSMEEQLTSTISKLKQDHATDLEKRVQKHAKKISDMETERAVALKRVDSEYAAIVKGLRDDVEALNGALLARDMNDFNLLEQNIFKPMSDLNIEARFLELVQEIDTLSRLEWKPDPKAWTNQILRRLSTNQRILKKQILQDSMWALLHDFIFCSPFRIFGEEGRTLELQWNEQCGKGQ